MKALLVGEYREGRLLGSTYELIAFAEKAGAESAMFLVGSESEVPKYGGTLYLADAGNYGEFNPTAHKHLLIEAVARENPDLVVFVHSSYGWDLAPRLALALQAAQVSEVVGVADGAYVVPACNAKLRRSVKSRTAVSVLTLQSGAFSPSSEPSGSPAVVKIDADWAAPMEFGGYEAAEKTGVDLTKSEIIVSAGRGIGKKDNLTVVAALAEAMGGEMGASRPVVDAEWAEHNRQVGSTGQAVSPKLYVACGISGAIQHLAGMKKSEFVVAINTDRDAPIGEVADVLVVADLNQFVPVLTDRIRAL
ncbi:electron transfer flavoprotein subunit alpha/FixB family protein [Desulfuromonas sp. TF]|uniref:electron transfer flavoprotein subunit alpha/FixB family protein n=1 Tax=Desulfuromonas sp. TF TaxID=1232410 RepID=UPI0003FB0507|nr:electron transfer flavoprotein subunit alpha/FixB family protein [Desulfuromonas sp. TF]